MSVAQNISQIGQSIAQKQKQIDDLRGSTVNFVTKSTYFKKLCKHVFQKCDVRKTGSINENELYTAVILVHLTLAKYAGEKGRIAFL